MSSINDFPAAGRVVEARDDAVVFQPTGTNYQMLLRTVGEEASAPVGSSLKAIIRLRARKIYTVPSGGNFITPIDGPPRIVQGRVRFIEERLLVVHASTNFVIEMPASELAIDLNHGQIAVGTVVNVVVLPGATIERLPSAAASVADKVAAVPAK